MAGSRAESWMRRKSFCFVIFSVGRECFLHILHIQTVFSLSFVCIALGSVRWHGPEKEHDSEILKVAQHETVCLAGWLMCVTNRVSMSLALRPSIQWCAAGQCRHTLHTLNLPEKKNSSCGPDTLPHFPLDCAQKQSKNSINFHLRENSLSRLSREPLNSTCCALLFVLRDPKKKRSGEALSATGFFSLSSAKRSPW